MSKPDLLFLSHRLPYPPDKGDKIRSYHLLRHLAQSYRIHLGCFIDDPTDWQYQNVVARWLTSSCLLPLTKTQLYMRTLASLATGCAFTQTCYRDRKLADWVIETCRQYEIKRVLVFSSAMGCYLSIPALANAHSVVDFVDLDSEKWRQYAEKNSLLRWLYRREARLMLQAEQQLARRAGHSLFISNEELTLFKQRADNAQQLRCSSLANGVDLSYFSPAYDSLSPYSVHATGKRAAPPVIVFTGAMDYQPNVEAVIWFTQQVMPRLRERFPQLIFAIVGREPTAQIRALSRKPGFLVTGRVPDTRPYLAHANVAVAPLQVARGIQNKVLEAMAMGTPVVASSAALCGIDKQRQLQALYADTPEQYLEQLTDLLGEPPRAKLRAQLGLDWVARHFCWSQHLGQLNQALQP